MAANDLARQWEDIAADALAAVDRVGRSGWLILGEEVAAFEAAARRVVGRAPRRRGGQRPRCPGDRAALRGRAARRPRPDDAADRVRHDAGDPARRRDAGVVRRRRQRRYRPRGGGARRSRRTPRSAPLLPVHLYGHPLSPSALEALAADHGVVVIEDCAQSAGARREGRPTAAAGRVAATSFYPTKNLGAMGDGGAVLTDDDAVAAARPHAAQLRPGPPRPSRRARPQQPAGRAARRDPARRAPAAARRLAGPPRGDRGALRGRGWRARCCGRCGRPAGARRTTSSRSR